MISDSAEPSGAFDVDSDVEIDTDDVPTGEMMAVSVAEVTSEDATTEHAVVEVVGDVPDEPEVSVVEAVPEAADVAEGADEADDIEADAVTVVEADASDDAEPGDEAELGDDGDASIATETAADVAVDGDELGNGGVSDHEHEPLSDDVPPSIGAMPEALTQLLRSELPDDEHPTEGDDEASVEVTTSEEAVDATEVGTVDMADGAADAPPIGDTSPDEEQDAIPSPAEGDPSTAAEAAESEVEPDSTEAAEDATDDADDAMDAAWAAELAPNPDAPVVEETFDDIVRDAANRLTEDDDDPPRPARERTPKIVADADIDSWVRTTDTEADWLDKATSHRRTNVLFLLLGIVAVLAVIVVMAIVLAGQ